METKLKRYKYLVLAETILIVALMIGVAVNTMTLVRTIRNGQGREAVLSTQANELSAQVDGLSTQVDGLNSDLFKAGRDLAEKDAEIQKLKDQQASSSDQIVNLQSDNVTQVQTITSYVKENSGLRQENDRLSQIVLCKNPLSDVNYITNAAMSTTLRSYVEDRWGTVSEATWTVLWSNSLASLHTVKVTKDNIWVYFVVGFGDSGGMKSIYSIGGNCFLNVTQ